MSDAMDGADRSLETTNREPPSRRSAQFPRELEQRENALIERRRKGGREPPAKPNPDAQPTPTPANRIGLALSGGGIRSATLSLGILQALARHKLLRRIDYLSTVSGGGYVGVFLGGMFTRWRIAGDPANREADWERVEGALRDPAQHPLSWLRENGRYLAPNGAGDLTLALAIVVRNLLAIHVVLGTWMLACALTLTGIRLLAGALARSTFVNEVLSGVPSALRIAGHHLHAPWIWWSPVVLVSVVACVALVVPLGIAYWLVRSSELGDRKWQDSPPPWLGALALGASSLLYLLWSWATARAHHAQVTWLGKTFEFPAPPDVSNRILAIVVLLVAIQSWIAWFFQIRGSVAIGDVTRRLSAEEARTQLTQSLRTAMIVTALLLGIGFIDSISQSLYAIFRVDGLGGVGRWVALGFSSVALVATLVQRAGGLFAETTQGRLKLPMQLVTALAGFTLLLAIVLGVFTAGHALTWNAESFRAAAPATSTKYIVHDEDGIRHVVRDENHAPLTLCRRPLAHEPTRTAARRLPEELTLCTPKEVDWPVFLSALALSWLFTCLFRRQYSFVNRSSLSALYGIRLARAYLGASNDEREKPQNQALTTLLPKDEMQLRDFAPHEYGGPLTIINVTVNETVAGRSQVQQRDRKGMGMAIGPAGVSVGVRHHASWKIPDSPDQRRLTPIDLQKPEGSGPSEVFQVFCKPVGTEAIAPHWPSVGRWMAISGAAVSTGLGSRTSIGLSLLIGLLNFRLGHWWRSGIDPTSRGMQSKSRLPTRDLFARVRSLFPVQWHLIDELFARFPGTSDADWYLSDGGHFENSGAYELIRRRLPLIIVCDNGADPDRCFDDLGNLVRKARIDFGAHVRFLDAAEIKDHQVVGTLSDIGFCGQLAAALEEGVTGQPRDTKPPGVADRKRVPTRYAALAEVTYEDEADAPSESRWLLWLRPAVLGNEPFDILNYQVGHSEFPQESTGDQFFDEAQWEAYRRLGEFMACQVFTQLYRDSNGPWEPFKSIVKRSLGYGCGSASMGRPV